MSEDTRKLVTIRKIAAIDPIPDADAIEVATVDGWKVVVRKGEYQPGDLAVYFEIDSALPIDGPFAFLAERSPKRVIDGETRHVLRTAKLRGQISQGLLMKPEEVFSSGDVGADVIHEGADMTELAKEFYGIVKWEKPLPEDRSIAGNFPLHIVRKTDSERVQNLTHAWDEIQEHRWVATEKIDGMSATYVMTEEGLMVCSRNFQIKEGNNAYWRMVEQYAMDEVIPIGCAIQGEIYGEGIQSNRLGVQGVHFAAFHSHDPHRQVEWDMEFPWAPAYIDLRLPATIEEAIEQADGIKSLISPSRLAEGIVWRAYKDVPALGRNTFKVISNKWLLKEK